jgi:poly(A) polymerase
MVRAVKYAAITGFSIPVNLKWKIRQQSNLLASISPSRLTEEIFKIINSKKAAAIVDLLDKVGLYSYLQPNAAKRMRENSAYKQSYLNRMADLNGVETYRGQAVGALFYDYLESTADWKPGVIENYKEVFQTARSFVLPMNPPRFEMEHAVRKFLAVRGITIKRLPPKVVGETGTTVASPSARKRRRHRKPKNKGTITNESNINLQDL